MPILQQFSDALYPEKRKKIYRLSKKQTENALFGNTRIQTNLLYCLRKNGMADFFAVRKGENMLSYLKKNEAPPPTEGALYKTVEIEGKRFSLYYGYYEECDRENPFCDPIPIYPDFLKVQIHTYC